MTKPLLPLKFTRISRRIFIASLLLGAPVLAAADAFWFEPGWVRTRKIRLGRDKPKHRFIHFTDLHHKGDTQYLGSVIKKINALAPQFVCFTGDIDVRFCCRPELTVFEV